MRPEGLLWYTFARLGRDHVCAESYLRDHLGADGQCEVTTLILDNELSQVESLKFAKSAQVTITRSSQELFTARTPVISLSL